MESIYSRMFIIYVEKHETWDKVPRNRYHRQRYSALRLIKIRNELINSLVWSCCPAKRIIYICTTSRFPCDVRLCPKLLFNEGKGYEGIRTIKIFEFDNTRSYFKELRSPRKKEKNMLDKLYTSTRGIYLQKLPLILPLQMNQSFNVSFKL